MKRGRDLAPIVKDLCARGYLPKELPPAFQSGDYADYVSTTTVSFSSSRLTEGTIHNLARPGNGRRRTTIPHPLSFLGLAQSLERTYGDIAAIYARAPYPSSTPIRAPSSGSRAFIQSFFFEQRMKERARKAGRARFILAGDLSQCYSSIYTHSFSWALDGKEVSKQKFRTGASTSLRGNGIDLASQRIQSKQTKGVPIGPDTSLVLAELVLTAIDIRMVADLRSRSISFPFNAHRITDDFEYFAKSRGEAEDVLLAWERAANHFELEVNSLKTEIREIPEPFDDPWTIALRQTQVRKGNEMDLLDLFGLANQLVREYRTASILGYVIRRTSFDDRIYVNRGLWATYSDLLLASVIADPSSIRFATPAFENALLMGRSLDRDAMTRTFSEIISYHSMLEHGSIVSWCLYIMRRFDLRIDSSTASSVASMSDNVSLLLLREMEENSMIDGVGPDFSEFISRAEAIDALSTSDWLLAYEAAAHRWTSSTAFGSEPEMKSMLDSGVKFLDFGFVAPLGYGAPLQSQGGGSDAGDYENIGSALDAFAGSLTPF